MGKRKTDPNWFKSCLYSDIEFKGYQRSFLDWAENSLSPDFLGIYSLLVRSQSLKGLIINNPDYKTAVKIIDEACSRFELPESVIGEGLMNWSFSSERIPVVITNKELNNIQLRDDEVYIRLDANTRLDDVIGNWSYIEKAQRRLISYRPQLQGAINPQLLYAIYKLRLRDDKGKRTYFSVIYRKWESGELLGYKPNVAQYKSEQSLARYYRRNIPKTDSL